MLNQPNDLKVRLQGLTPDEYTGLKNAAYFQAMVNLMRSTGLFNVVLGSLTVWLSDVNPVVQPEGWQLLS